MPTAYEVTCPLCKQPPGYVCKDGPGLYRCCHDERVTAWRQQQTKPTALSTAN